MRTHSEVVKQLEVLFIGEKILTLKELKFCWIVTFGYKPSKSQMLEKFEITEYTPKSRVFERGKLYEIIEVESKYFDKGQ